MNNAVLSAPGDRIVHTIGRITITLTYVRGSAYTVTAEQGGTYRIQELCTAHRDEQTARARARLIAASLNGGVSVEQLIGSVQAAQASVLAAADAILDEALQVAVADPRTVAAEPTITALQAAKTDDSDELAASIRANLDQAEADRRNRQAALNADVAEIMANSAGFRTLADTVPTTGQRNTSHLAAAPTSDPMDRIITTAAGQDGRIVRGGHDGEATSRQILALAKRGIATPIRERIGREWRITGAQLTGSGFRRAEELKAAA